MIKLLHSADWHLDSPLLFRDPRQSELLRRSLLEIPGKIAALTKENNCDMLLLSGDLFDGPYAADTLRTVKNALEDVSVPVFIAPGNHDFVGNDSPWLSTAWPENVHIFTHPVIESAEVADLDCCVYGAGFVRMDCPSLLEDFVPNHTETHAVAVLHGDPTQVTSPYCPITTQQVAQSGLDYIALGHIHKGDSFRVGKTLCAWPGCPMGRGFDELGEKGVLLVTLDNEATSAFLPLSGPKFFDIQADPSTSLASLLPPVGNEDFYRITFTGSGIAPDLPALSREYAHFPNLTLRDKTTPPVDVWGSAGVDTFEGIYFKRLRDTYEAAEDKEKQNIRLAAELSRMLLDGQEVVLP